ncbi:unnamed protein product [Orchesella dallaii]|uniref:Uncharacterized protein n=1 Tax=Orchesella dallaii TaxID=48710 RepID=A0ABP1Q2X4_9HEXA
MPNKAYSKTDYSTKRFRKPPRNFEGRTRINQSAKNFRLTNYSFAHASTSTWINQGRQSTFTSTDQTIPEVDTNEFEATNSPTMLTDEQPSVLQVSQPFEISLSSINQTDITSNFSDRDDVSWSKKYFLLTILTVPYTESRCFICESKEGRQNVSVKEARLDLWYTNEIYLPNSIRRIT